MLGLGKSESPMHCLYCDRPLALLKRLTGDGEFCSKEHRKQYHQEHNQLAVARLLEAQRAVKPAPLKKKDSATPSTAKPGDRQPQLASFVPEYSREAKADSGSSRFTSDPRFVEFATFSVSAGAPSTQPRTAMFQSERIEPRSFGAAMRFPSRSSLQPPVQLAETLSSSHSGVIVRGRPHGAGFVSERPPAPIAPVAPAVSTDTVVARFKVDPGVIDIAAAASLGGDYRLRQAKFLSDPAAPRSASDRVRALPVDARWQALQPALPERLAGRIAPVLGSPLRRPVRIASQGEAPALFEIRLRPVVFPAPPLVMASLSGRPHHTDRLGFTPP